MTLRAILTDLGGVVTSFDVRRFPHNLRHGILAGRDLDWIDRIVNGNAGTELRMRFERGQIDEEEYARSWEARLGTALPRNAFWRAYEDIFEGDPRVSLLYRRLQSERGMRLVAVTNTDVRRLREMLRVGALNPDAVIASFAAGVMKPERTIYLAAREAARASANECLFVDDDPENVLAAEKIGMQGHAFTGYDGLVAALTSHGVTIA